MAERLNVALPEVRVQAPAPQPVQRPLPAWQPPLPATVVPKGPPRRVRLDMPALLLGSLILWFGAIHIRLWFQHPGQPVGLGLVILELVQGVLFFIRRQQPGRRQPLAAWVSTTVGSWGALAVRPAGGTFFHAPLLFGTRAMLGVQAPWLALQVVGTIAAVVALSNLGRSFGLLPGNRGIRTGGAYRIVRHPAYAAYMFTDLGYLLENFSIWNLAVLTITLLAQLSRIRLEEATLAQDPAYRAYRSRVHFRLVPGIY